MAKVQRVWRVLWTKLLRNIINYRAIIMDFLDKKDRFHVMLHFYVMQQIHGTQTVQIKGFQPEWYISRLYRYHCRDIPFSETLKILCRLMQVNILFSG